MKTRTFEDILDQARAEQWEELGIVVLIMIVLTIVANITIRFGEDKFALPLPDFIYTIIGIRRTRP